MSAMTPASFKRSFRLLRKWGYQCIVCGHGFAHMACVTVEHIIPYSIIGKNNKTNIAPSHYRCNQLKRDMSLFEASRVVKATEERLGSRHFEQWLAMRVPHREVPWFALIPIVDAEWFFIGGVGTPKQRCWRFRSPVADTYEDES